MTMYVNLSRFKFCVGNGFQNFLAIRTSLNNNSNQVCNYTKKSAEEKLGIQKPKRPLTPFFKFMTQMRPALMSKNPGISNKDAVLWTSKHWQELDHETKSKLSKEYAKDLEDYKKIKQVYESTLTEEQKDSIKKLKEEMAADKEKRKLKADYKEMGRPKKPPSSYILFSLSRKEKFDSANIKEFQNKCKTEWMKLPKSERAEYHKQAENLMIKYKKDLQDWELKMISMGRMDLLRAKPSSDKKSKSKKPE